MLLIDLRDFLLILHCSIRLHVRVSVRECMIEMKCVYDLALYCFYNVRFYVPVYHHVNYCLTARALVQCERYALK